LRASAFPGRGLQPTERRISSVGIFLNISVAFQSGGARKIRSSLRRLFILDTARLLLERREIQLDSREHRILRRVAADGVSDLGAREREFYDQVLVPMIEAARKAQ